MGIFEKFNKFRKWISEDTDKNKKATIKKNSERIYTISKEVIETAIAAAKESHPHEFIALLGGSRKRKKHIEELIFLPSLTGGVSAIIHTEMLPLGMRIMGTIHSHPSPYPYPSQQDLDTFSEKGEVHIIIAYPYNMNSWRSYGRDGKPLKVVVVDI